MGKRQDHYEVLGVHPDAEDEVVRAAYRALVAKYHPDKNPGDRDAELKLKRLNAAFAVLGDPAKKRQYDELTQSPEHHDEPTPAPAPEPVRWNVSEETPRPKPAPKAKRAESPPPSKVRVKTCWSCGAKVPLDARRCGNCWKEQFADDRGERRPPEKVVVRAGNRFTRGLASLLVAGIIAAVIAAMKEDDTEKRRAALYAASTTDTQVTPTATATEAPIVAPSVPPLLPNESPPIDVPNYFEPREVSAGGIVAAFDGCQTSAHKADPSLSTDMISSYCTCVTDAVRRNAHNGGVNASVPTSDQMQKCATAVRSGSSVPVWLRLHQRAPPTFWNAMVNLLLGEDGRPQGPRRVLRVLRRRYVCLEAASRGCAGRREAVRDRRRIYCRDAHPPHRPAVQGAPLT